MADRQRPQALLLGLLALAAALVAGVFLAPAGAPAHGQQAVEGGGLVCASFGGGPPYAFETYEAGRDRAPYLLAQRLAAANLLLPGDPDFALPPIETGPATQRQLSPGAAIPDALLHAIGWIESRLTQAAAHVPFEGTGAVLISSSCAYGLMQVASFFSNEGDVPSRAEALAGTHYAFNIAAGARILVEKWAQDLFPVVGLGQPEMIESWYYATWAYNGWALANHPAGPEVDPFRAPYACDGPFNGYPYQELVLGCVVQPPRLDGAALWPAAPVQLPDLATLAQPGGPLDPEFFFQGWATVLSAPFTGASVARPFAGMDAPLPPGARPHPPPALGSAPAERRTILGDPALAMDLPALHLSVSDDVIQPALLVIRNAGEGILAYRLVPDVDWLRTSLAAGVALGSRPGAPPSPSTVRVEPLAGGLPAGFYQGTILVEALLPDGSVQAAPVTVTLDKQGVPRYEAGRPQS